MAKRRAKPAASGVSRLRLDVDPKLATLAAPTGHLPARFRYGPLLACASPTPPLGPGRRPEVARFEEACDAWLAKWRAANPDATSRAAYEELRGVLKQKAGSSCR